jgi:hypothetical protein
VASCSSAPGGGGGYAPPPVSIPGPGGGTF